MKVLIAFFDEGWEHEEKEEEEAYGCLMGDLHTFSKLDSVNIWNGVSI